MKAKIKYLFIGLLIALNLSSTDAQNSDFAFSNATKFNWKPIADRIQVVMQDNELERHEMTSEPSIYSNPLLINGKMLNYSTFDIYTKGILTIVKGAPESAEAMPLPFYVSIRRDGKIIEDKKMSFSNTVLQKVNLSEIFPFCKQGDLLIIKPARKEDWQAKRILRLIDGRGC